MTATLPARTAEGAGPLAPNYHPLPVTLTTGEGAWVRDTGDRTYLDMLAGYSALNFGHRHPALLAAAHAQLDRLTLSSRAFDHDLLHPFAAALSDLARPVVAGAQDGTTPMVLPMNTGAEAVETAIKAARKWGYDVRGVAPDRATVVVAAGNFHGRTTTIVSFSTDPEARDCFGPHTPGFRIVPFGDAEALRAAVDETTVAVLLEPIQGEQGVVVPAAGYWPAVREICTAADVLLIADEIQSGLGRTGTTFALELWDVRADLVTLGKALGGGVLPVSAVVGRPDVLGVLTAGTHGSTFGGNPLACAVGIAVVDLLRPGTFQERARTLGAHLHERLATLVDTGLLVGTRGVGLWAGLDVDPARMTGRELCERLLRLGVLAKDTHGSTIRLAPPLMIDADDLDLALDRLTQALR
ncbi:ornithine--oxo-acid transaminase [Cellulomonas hominis]|uniref:ornithine--oxo-acid transaminase n=1 Tax=Cellulomonas hominis TaxID=156981 RepID=UPI001B8F384E|nr:ornithine--oxo-acid transaminase [Cellulomonas hominis]VTR78864.1 Ornithine aminotransferase [Cellulomonas hominis]